MKLRVRGDSLRFRLMQAEVDTLGRGERVEERTGFGDTEFVYALVLTNEVSKPKAMFHNGTIEVALPAAEVRTWATSEAVGIEGTQEISADRTLRIVVEKDFACLKPREHEDDHDAFPNPNTSC